MAKSAIRKPTRTRRTVEGEKDAAMPEASQTVNQRNHGCFGLLAHSEVVQ